MTKEELDKVGPIGSTERLEAIAMGNDKASEAAITVLYRRHRRRELMACGLTFEQACILLRSETDNLQHYLSGYELERTTLTH